MKHVTLYLLFLIFSASVCLTEARAAGNWTWAGGRTFNENRDGTFTQGIPGRFYGAATFADQEGRFYLLGGYGADAAGALGYLNSLWRYNPYKNEWEWIKGCSLANQPGRDVIDWPIINGNPHPEFQCLYSIPGARVFPATAIHQLINRYWLFGGRGYDVAGHFGLLNDYWICGWDTNSPWSWRREKRDGTGVNQKGIYGTRGMGAAVNTPGGREGAFLLADSKQQIWLFGGEGLDASGNIGYLDDLWCRDPRLGNNWVWVKGASAVGQKGIYGTQGKAAPANLPGGRRGMAAWIDSADRIWIFGGIGHDATGAWGYLNDLWRYDPATGHWTWIKGNDHHHAAGVYGTRGAAAVANTPGGREGAARWVDSTGKVWLFGGSGLDATGAWGYLNDLWCYDPASGNWTWVKGSNKANQKSTAGAPGVAASANTPGGRAQAMAWCDNLGRFFLYGGYHFDPSVTARQLDELWSYDPASGNWTQLKPTSAMTYYGSYGLQGLPDKSNIPGSRAGTATWTDAAGRLWLFGGLGYGESGAHKDKDTSLSWLGQGYLDDLWCFDPKARHWTWVKGNSQVNLPGSWGTQGVAAESNYPASRDHASTWVDKAGRFWLFGGRGYFNSYMADLWCFDPVSRLWTWVKGGSYQSTDEPVYGTRGVPAPANTPGGRYGSASWVDAAGRLWLFGGNVGPHPIEPRNDLWCFDPATKNWTWVKGARVDNESYAVFGTKGAPDPANTPGGRFDANAWTDPSGGFWLFGGAGRCRNADFGVLNDLWRFDPATGNWTWMKGNNQIEQPSVFGTQGVPNPANTPGARSGATAWTDRSGRFWLYAGDGPQGITDEVWSFNPATKNWTWVNGSGKNDQPTSYGPLGTASAQSRPGGRFSSSAWADQQGRLWMLGGFPANQGLPVEASMDLWYFTESNAVAPNLWNRLE